MRGALRLTTALYPSMALSLLLSFSFSSRTSGPGGLLRDRVFPLISRGHPPGAGTFAPGSFALSFFLPSLAGMMLLNLFLPAWSRPLRAHGATVFFYIAVVLLAICEVAADTLIPMLALPGPWRFRVAVSMLNASFFGAVLLAALLSAGADREW